LNSIKSLFAAVGVILLMVSVGVAQPTITANDIPNTPGNWIDYESVYAEEGITGYDLGSPGGGNNWDFTEFEPNEWKRETLVNPEDSPFHETFQRGNRVTMETDTTQPEVGYNYMELAQQSLTGLGFGIVMDTLRMALVFTNTSPTLNFPVEFDDRWVTFMESTFMETQSVDTIWFHYDAYGRMTTPGGAFDCIRLQSYSHHWVLREGEEPTSYSHYGYDWFAPGIGGLVGLGSFEGEDDPEFAEAEELRWLADYSLSVDNQPELLRPEGYSLTQNYPNPFNSRTMICYQTPRNGCVNLKVYDHSGRLVEVLQDGNVTVGFHSLVWDATDFPTGIYFIRLTNVYVGFKTIKLVLIK